MKKSLFILSLLLIMTLVACNSSNAAVSLSEQESYSGAGSAILATDNTYLGNFDNLINSAPVEIDDDTILFGSYPQTEVTDKTLKNTLNGIAGTLPTSSNSGKWTSYDYYISGTVKKFMWFIDVENGGNKYRGVYFESYRPYNADSSGVVDNSNQYKNGYGYSYTNANGSRINNIYWFKYEPISWTILAEENGKKLILCDVILDAQLFDVADGGYKNNYENSSIRNWLNSTFYKIAFDDAEKANIVETMVDNSVESTGDSKNQFLSNNTNDKVFLLSYAEAILYFASDEARIKQPTQYAKSQGAYVSTNSASKGNGYWMLRSPFAVRDYYVKRVDYNGEVDRSRYVGNTDTGIVPAMWIVF